MRSRLGAVLATFVLLTASGGCADGDAVEGGLAAARRRSASTTTSTSPSTSSSTTTTTLAPPTSPLPAPTAAPAPAPAPAPSAAPVAEPAPQPPARPAPGTPSSLGGCSLFPRSSYWYADVSTLPVHPASATYVANVGASRTMHPDFGSGEWDGGPIGIPFVAVPADQPGVPISFQYASESDPGPYPIPCDPPIEGGPSSSGDRHVLVVQSGSCRLYEVYAAHPDGGGGWTAGSGAVWDLGSNALRPDGWTSGDAAGLPILPGLVRYDEVAAGRIDHAIRITVPRTHDSYVWPARHRAGGGDTTAPPMGTWFRLRADYDISGFPHEAKVILQALKTHGAIVADNGSAWYISGAPDPRWDNGALRALKNVRGDAFEVVDASSIMVDPSSGEAR